MKWLEEAADNIATFMDETAVISLDREKKALAERFANTMCIIVPYWLTPPQICQHDALKSLYACYAIVLMHKEMIKPLISRHQSTWSYVRSYGISSAGDQYYAQIKALLDKIFECIEAHLRTLPQNKTTLGGSILPQGEPSQGLPSNLSTFPCDHHILKLRLGVIGNLEFSRALMTREIANQNPVGYATYQTAKNTLTGWFAAITQNQPTTGSSQTLQLTPQSQKLHEKWNAHLKSVLSGEYDFSAFQELFTQPVEDNSNLLNPLIGRIRNFLTENEISDVRGLLCQDCYVIKKINGHSELIRPEAKRMIPS